MTSEDTKAYLDKYAAKVGASTFFHDPIANMTREELLGLVGWMQEEMQRIDDARKREIEMERAFRQSALRRSHE